MTLLQDLRYGLRVSFKNPAFTLVAVATLAVGIAANTTVFSWIDAVLLHPLPGVANSSELVSFESVTANGEFIPACYPDYREYRDHLTLLSGLAMSQPNPFSVGENDHAERVWGELVSGNYFDVLGVKPILGRVFSRDEYGDKPGAYPLAVISSSLWSREFNSDPGIMGRTIRVNRQQLTIIGVVPSEFHGAMPGLTFEMWIPMVMGTQLNTMPDWMLQDRQSRMFFGTARLKPGVSIARAQAEISALAREMGKAFPSTNEGIDGAIFPVWKGHFGAPASMLGPLRILMAVAAVVFFIVCANVANLLLARATARQKEFGLRFALGAGRSRIIRQLLTESLLLAAMGAIVGVPLAMWMSQSLGYLVPPSSYPVTLSIPMSADVLLFTILLSILACVVSGLAPALTASRADLNDTLKEGGRGSQGGPPQRIRGLLVATEVALALVAIIGAGLFAKSFQMARQIKPGFDSRGVMVSQLALGQLGYSVPDRINFCARLRDRLQSQPGVSAVSYADYIPLGIGDGSWEDLKIEGYVPARSENMKIYRTVAGPGYLDVMGLRLLDGRDFTDRDDIKNKPVIIVNRTFVQRFFGGRYAIGRQVHGWGKWFTIVGVVNDTKFFRPNETQRALFYVPFRQVYREDLPIALYVKSAGNPNDVIADVRREVHSMDAGAGVFAAMPLAEYIEFSLFAQKMAAALLGALGAIALILAAVGLYSVMAYSITQRTQEIGIRMALGAKPGDVIGLVIRQGMRLAAAGLLAGVILAIAVMRLASGLLVNVSATDPLVFAVAAIFLAAVSMAASYLPARRATRIDPNTALRCQ
jgi:predicted permease